MASEVMAVALTKELSNSEVDLLTVTSGHTYTILNISICETAGAAETFDLYVRDDAGANDYEIYSDQALGANETFEHTDRIVLQTTDVLSAKLASAGNVDIVISYLDQTLQQKIMSGIIGSKLNIRSSGRISKLGTDGQVLTSSGAGVAANFEDAAAGGADWQAIETGSTMTAVAGNGYWIDTTQNACTITLPS